MGKKNIYPSDYDDAVIETTANYNPMPCNLSWMTKHAANTMMEQAILDAGQDKLSAQLARGCMENIGSLAMTAEQLSSMNPDVANCYRAIIAMYQPRAKK